MNKAPQTLKGFRDFLPREKRQRDFVAKKFAETFELFGFEPLETPALEYEEILMGKYGEEGDKLMYRFTDNGDRRVALRYDQTVPLARLVAQYKDLVKPFKRYQIQPVWRAENTQKGRYREFVQCDIDIAGTDSLMADAEIIACSLKSLKALGFTDFEILINDRKVFADIDPRAINIIDKLDKVGEEKVREYLKEAELDASLLDKVKNFPETDELKLTRRFIKELVGSESNIVYAPTLARGLDYYTGTIFEIKSKDYSGGSLCGGGRYDNLIGIFAGEKIPAVGCAFGFDRILEAMSELNLLPDDTQTTKVLVTVFSKELGEESIKAANFLRDKEVNTEIYLDASTKLEKQLKYADKKGIPFVLIIGEEEVKQNKVTLKNMQTGENQLVSLAEVVNKI